MPDEGKTRPSPAARAAVRLQRQEDKAAAASLPYFGPDDEATFLRQELRDRDAEFASLSGELEEEKTKPALGLISFENLWAEEDGKLLEFYTGLTRDMWTSLWNLLDCRNNMQSKQSAATDTKGRQRSRAVGLESSLSFENQLVLTLLRLRLGYLEQDLAYHFCISIASVSRIFTMWINFLYLRLGSSSSSRA